VDTAQILNTLVTDVLAASRATPGVFTRYGMGCVGCVCARFETVAEVAGAYGLDPGELALSLADVLRGVEECDDDHH
jgi:hybrid cluster-associated redox disulfide protein